MDHETMGEEGWQVKITTPEDSIVYANTKWFRVSLVTGEDLMPPHTNPSEMTSTVNIGPKGAPLFVNPPVTGYQSMTAMSMPSVLRSKLTLNYAQDCTIFTVRLEDIVGFHDSGEMQRCRMV
ncbi:MAG: hypothetical protein GY768_32125 [Planctomycetaceae bacterium]|nr:hypothetical protein [Planctomycetaceae bacterium]